MKILQCIQCDFCQWVLFQLFRAGGRVVADGPFTYLVNESAMFNKHALVAYDYRDRAVHFAGNFNVLKLLCFDDCRKINVGSCDDKAITFAV